MGKLDNGGASFGSCCDALADALGGDDFEPLITISENGVLYLTVGLIEMEDDEPGMMDHPVFFCPFCGTNIQTVEEVQAKDHDL